MSRLRAAIAGAEASHLLVTNPKDVGYLTGFLGGDSYLLVPAANGTARPVVISDFRYQEELEKIRPLADIVIRSEPMPVAAAKAAAPASRLGIQAEHTVVALRSFIASKLGDARIVDTTGLVAGLRLVKDDAEVALIKKAIRIQEDALRAVLSWIKPGRTELEVASRIESEMKSRGSSEPGFQTIVAAGAAGSLPHYRPQARKLRRNSSVLIDWGAVWRGYHSDMTRTFAIGKWPDRIAEIYDVVLDAHTLAADALAPGRSTLEIDAIARRHIAACGYGDFFGHSLGHGIGLDGHEDPRLSHILAPTILQPGSVVTVEPGIYLPGLGGVRIEDDYLVKPTGAERLTRLPRDLDWATL